MAEITDELMYEVLKKLQADMAGVNDSLREGRLNAMQSHMIGLSQDIQNIYSVLTPHDARLGRIERRLDIYEPA